MHIKLSFLDSPEIPATKTPIASALPLCGPHNLKKKKCIWYLNSWPAVTWSGARQWHNQENTLYVQESNCFIACFLNINTHDLDHNYATRFIFANHRMANDSIWRRAEKPHVWHETQWICTQCGRLSNNDSLFRRVHQPLPHLSSLAFTHSGSHCTRWTPRLLSCDVCGGGGRKKWNKLHEWTPVWKAFHTNGFYWSIVLPSSYLRCCGGGLWIVLMERGQAYWNCTYTQRHDCVIIPAQ